MAKMTKTQKKRAVERFMATAKRMFLRNEITVKEYENIERTYKKWMKNNS